MRLIFVAVSFMWNTWTNPFFLGSVFLYKEWIQEYADYTRDVLRNLSNIYDRVFCEFGRVLNFSMYTGCIKLHASRAFMPYVPTSLTFWRTLSACMSSRVCLLRTFLFYVPYVPSFFTCLTCLPYFYVPNAP